MRHSVTRVEVIRSYRVIECRMPLGYNFVLNLITLNHLIKHRIFGMINIM